MGKRAGRGIALSLGLWLGLLPLFLFAQEGPRAKRLAPTQVCGALYFALRSQPFTARTMEEYLADTRLLLSNGFDPSDVSQSARKELLAMARDPQFRPLLVDSLLADLRRRSESSRRSDHKGHPRGRDRRKIPGV